MNANPPINVGIGQQRRRAVLQKLMQQAANRQPAPGAQDSSQGGGRLVTGGGRARLPMPHITRQSSLPASLIAALGIGGKGIPDDPNAVGLANSVSSDIHSQGAPIPDWINQPAASDAGIAASTGAPMPPASPSGMAPAPAGQLGQAPDPASGNYTPGASAGLFSVGTNAAINNGAPAPDITQNTTLVHLGNGLFYDPSTDAIRGGGSLAYNSGNYVLGAGAGRPV